MFYCKQDPCTLFSYLFVFYCQYKMQSIWLLTLHTTDSLSQIILGCGVCLLHCRMLHTIPDLSYWMPQPKCLWTLSNVPWGEVLVEMQGFLVFFSCLFILVLNSSLIWPAEVPSWWHLSPYGCLFYFFLDLPSFLPQQGITRLSS